MLTGASDRELLGGLGRGDAEAVAALYRQHGARMVAFARRYVKDAGTAEDVVAGLIGRWLERPPRVREAERLAAFLSTSVYHASIDWIRRDRAEQGQPARPARNRNPVEPPTAREDLRARLPAALEQLSADERTLLETHYGGALTTEECMELLGISRPAFHQRLHRARVHLEELLK